MLVQRVAFRAFNRLLVALWWVGLGWLVNQARPVTGRILVLGTRGRKSGQIRRTPLNYSLGEGCCWCAAGFGQSSDWFQNLLADPEVEIWLPQSQATGRARPVTEEAEFVRRLRCVLADSGWIARWLAGLDLRTSDRELGHLAAEYRLIRIEFS
ncbi:nitroreductase family deazaflavin-dependent oxidoreductase [bacterium]|nr:nitroreductase family deazaflavin-dependent oxidoreductase [bacterium]